MSPQRVVGGAIVVLFMILAAVGTTSLGLFIFYGIMIMVGAFILWLDERAS